MKRIVFALLLIVPCFCWAQSGEMDDSVVKALKGKVPGITIKQNTGKAMPGTVHNPVLNRIQPPLYVINGKIMDKAFNLRSISVEDIEEFYIYKGEETLNLFGEQGRYGVICISTKPQKEYEVIVFDPGFDSFLATQRSKEFYSEATLKAKNILMVNEWNSRHRQPMQYNPNIYEVSIDYDPKTDYGLEVEYQLHMFFRYMEKANNMSLIGDYYAANRLTFDYALLVHTFK